MVQPRTLSFERSTFPDRLKALLYRGLAVLIWEATFTPSTGITAVITLLRRVLPGRGVLIAPWHGEMSRAKKALGRGDVMPTGYTFAITFAGHRHEVCVLIADQQDHGPIIYLAIEGRFAGTSPYNSRDLHEDTLFFAKAVQGLLNVLGATDALAFVGADWETVPTLHLVHTMHSTGLWLHNVYDASLADAVRTLGSTDEFSPFLGETALGFGTKFVDVLMAVNKGFSSSLSEERIYTRVLADHLQGSIRRAVGVDNANFTSLRAEFVDLEKLLSSDLRAGIRRLDELKQAARAELPSDLCRKLDGRVAFGVMGRRASQKLPEVVVAAARQLLNRDRQAPLLFIFATTSGDDAGSEVRLQQIRDLAADYPDHVYFTDGHIDFYDAMLNAWHYNVMASLWEPHGGCFSGLPVPVARAIDGLPVQIHAYRPEDPTSARLSHRYHGPLELPSGLLFREPPALDPEAEVRDLRQLVEGIPPFHNATVRGMATALSSTLERAIAIWKRPDEYATLVRGTLRQQLGQSWSVPLGGMITLIEQARRRRSA